MGEHEKVVGVDYEMPMQLVVDAPTQLKALGHPLRSEVLALLGERAATASQLAEATDTPVGTVGHHLGVLEEAGLVHVVRTRQVRGITAKYYGRTAAVFLFDDAPDSLADTDVDDWRRHALPDPVLRSGPDGQVGTVRFARVDPERLPEWHDRIVELSAEFATQDPGDGHEVYALSLQVYPTTRRALPPDDPEDAA